MSNTNTDQRIDELEKQIVELKEENSAMKALFQQPEVKQEKKGPPKLPADPTFTLNKKKYEVLVPAVDIPGIGYRTAEDILQDIAAQAELVKLGSGAIKPIA